MCDEPKLILSGLSKVLMVKLGHASKQAGIKVKLRLVDQDRRVPGCRVAQAEIAVDDLFLAGTKFVYVVSARCGSNGKFQTASRLGMTPRYSLSGKKV